MITYVEKGCLAIEHLADTEVWKYLCLEPNGSALRNVAYYGVRRGGGLIAAYRARGSGGIEVEVGELLAAHAAYGRAAFPPARAEGE
jgi:hypothetical protein